jgi:hypothetical protein
LVIEGYRIIARAAAAPGRRLLARMRRRLFQDERQQSTRKA